MKMPTDWISERLKVSSSQEGELTDLQKIYDDTSYISFFTGYRNTKKEPMAAELRHENLPPGGVPERHSIQSIRLHNGEVIGYLVLYSGFPNESTLWVATFAVHPTFQKQGFGREVFEKLIEKALEWSYKNISLSVSERNLPAVKFWTAVGFQQIAKIAGTQKESSTKDTNPTLWLSKRLT